MKWLTRWHHRRARKRLSQLVAANDGEVRHIDHATWALCAGDEPVAVVEFDPEFWTLYFPLHTDALQAAQLTCIVGYAVGITDLVLGLGWDLSWDTQQLSPLHVVPDPSKEIH